MLLRTRACRLTSTTTGPGGVFAFEGLRTGIYYLYVTDTDPATGEEVFALRYWFPVSAVGQEVTVDLVGFTYTTDSCFYNIYF